MKLNPPIPKEHGSWAMLIVPLFLGLVIAPTWHWRAIVLLVAAFGFFLVRYPLATLVKTRRRASPEKKAYLWRWTIIYGTVTAFSGGWLVLVEGLRWLAVIGVVGALLLGLHLWLVYRRQEMSVLGELSGIFGLALGAPMAYYTASGLLDGTAAALWLVNALYFGGTVFYIKLKVRGQPRQPAPESLNERLAKGKACLAYQGVVLVIVLGLIIFKQMPVLILVAFLPVTVKVWRGVKQWQDKKSLSLVRLGVTELVHAVVFAGLVIIAFL